MEYLQLVSLFSCFKSGPRNDLKLFLPPSRNALHMQLTCMMLKIPPPPCGRYQGYAKTIACKCGKAAAPFSALSPQTQS